jgi:hypothetical protein
MLVMIFLSLGAALMAVVLAVVAALLISYKLALGDLGILFTCVVPVATGLWIFIFTFRKLRAYRSN